LLPVNDLRVEATATDLKGCKAYRSSLIKVDKQYDVFVPNAFSPDGDGFNDLFEMHCGKSVKKCSSFRIFDRWGTQIYEANNFAPNDHNVFWDGQFRGKLMEVGVFVWLAEVEFLDGHLDVLKGDVTLVR
jgi:gliding motility-associated-like protein